MLNRISIMSCVFALIGSCFLVAAAVQLSAHRSEQAAELFVVAVGAFVAAATCMRSIKSCEFKTSQTGIELPGSDAVVPWNDFSSLALGRFACDPDLIPATTKKQIRFRLAGQAIVLPRTDDESPQRLYSRIVSMFLDNYRTRLRGPLKVRHSALVEKYNSDQVISAVATAPRTGTPRLRGRIVLAFLVWAIFGIVAALLPRGSGAGAVVASVGFLMSVTLFVLWTREKGRYRERGDCDHGIVISPDGIALRTKKLTGEMSWDELIKMELTPNPTRPTHLKIRLSGIDILLAEEFDIPLWYIEKFSTATRLEARGMNSATARPQPEQPKQPRKRSDNPYAPPESL
ncbi:MAG: hypothetical protein Aurels2KO_14540 [Aureliella sp.]